MSDTDINVIKLTMTFFIFKISTSTVFKYFYPMINPNSKK